MAEQPRGGSAERELATPEGAKQSGRTDRDDAPEAKLDETPTDEKLPADQDAMQPDSS